MCVPKRMLQVSAANAIEQIALATELSDITPCRLKLSQTLGKGQVRTTATRDVLRSKRVLEPVGG